MFGADASCFVCQFAVIPAPQSAMPQRRRWHVGGLIYRPPVRGQPLEPARGQRATKVIGDGAWQARKGHLAMASATSDIRAVQFTPSRDGDSLLLPERRDQILEAEAATPPSSSARQPRSYRSARTADRGSRAVRKPGCPAAYAHHETLRATRRYGRTFRKRWT